MSFRYLLGGRWIERFDPSPLFCFIGTGRDVILSKKSLSKRLSGDVVVGGQNFDNSVLGELLFVRYMGVAMKECGGDEKRALGICCDVLGYSESEGARIWSYRHKLITANEAAFVASDDILRASIRKLYKKLIDALLDRDFSSEGVRSIVEALRAVANLEAGIAVSRGLVPLSSDSGDAPGSVNVSRSNVIIVPMPDSAQERVRDIGGNLMRDDAVTGKKGQYYEEYKEAQVKIQKRNEAMSNDIELDPIEEARKVADNVREGRFS